MIVETTITAVISRERPRGEALPLLVGAYSTAQSPTRRPIQARMVMTTPGGRTIRRDRGRRNAVPRVPGRVRAGDEWAADEFVRRYEPAVRLEIRLRLRDPRLRRLLEPADLCQSVLKSFFVRATSGHLS